MDVGLNESIGLVHWALVIHLLPLFLALWFSLIEGDLLDEIYRLISLNVNSSPLFGVIWHFYLHFAVKNGISHWFETIQLLYYFLGIPWGHSVFRSAAQMFLFVGSLSCCIVVECKIWSLIGRLGFTIGDAWEWAFAELIVDYLMNYVFETLMEGLLLRSTLDTTLNVVLYLQWLPVGLKLIFKRSTFLLESIILEG